MLVGAANATNRDEVGVKYNWNLRLAKIAGTAYARIIHVLNCTLEKLVKKAHKKKSKKSQHNEITDSSVVTDFLMQLTTNNYEKLYLLYPTVVNTGHPIWRIVVNAVYDMLAWTSAIGWKWYSADNVVGE